MAEITKSSSGTVYQIAGRIPTSMDYQSLTNTPIVIISSLPSTGDNDKIYKLGNDLYVTSDNGVTWTYINGALPSGISGGMAYKGLIDYCCDTLARLQGLTNTDHGLRTGDTGYVIATGLKYTCATSTSSGSTWTSVASPMTAVGDFFVVEYYYGYYLDGNTYTGQVQAELICVDASTTPVTCDLILDTTEIVDYSISPQKLSNFTFTNASDSVLPTDGTVRIEDYVQGIETSVGWLWQTRLQPDVTLTNPTQTQINALGKFIVNEVTFNYTTAPSSTITITGFYKGRVTINISHADVTNRRLYYISDCAARVQFNSSSLPGIVCGNDFNAIRCKNVELNNISINGNIIADNTDYFVFNSTTSNATLQSQAARIYLWDVIKCYLCRVKLSDTTSIASDNSNIVLEEITGAIYNMELGPGTQLTIGSNCTGSLGTITQTYGQPTIIADNRAAHSLDTFLRSSDKRVIEFNHAFGPMPNNSTVDLSSYRQAPHPLEYRVRYTSGAGAGYLDRRARQNTADGLTFNYTRVWTHHQYGAADNQSVYAGIEANQNTWETVAGTLWWYTGRDNAVSKATTYYTDSQGALWMVTATDYFEFWATADTAAATRYFMWREHLEWAPITAV